MAWWKYVLGIGAVGGAAAILLGGDDSESKLPDGGSGKDGAQDEPGELTPDRPPRPEPPEPDLDVSLGWPPNVHIIERPEQFTTWSILDVVDGKRADAARGTVYFGFSRQWANFQTELDHLRELTPRNDEVRFVIFDLEDAKAATGQPAEALAYVATAVGPMGEPRELAPLLAKNMAAKNIAVGRWRRLIEWARNGPDSDATGEGQAGLGSQPTGGEAPPSAGSYGVNAQTRYLPDHPRGPHWVVTICDLEQLPDGKVLRCRWYLWKGKHATTLAQADYSSTDKGKPWSGSLSSRAAAFQKAVDFIDDYLEVGTDTRS